MSKEGLDVLKLVISGAAAVIHALLPVSPCVLVFYLCCYPAYPANLGTTVSCYAASLRRVYNATSSHCDAHKSIARHQKTQEARNIYICIYIYIYILTIKGGIGEFSSYIF